MSAESPCPQCGSPIVFRVATSLAATCSACGQVVARGGANVEAIGTSNEILQLPSALSLGARGTFRKHAFTVVGRVQLQHALGGHWNEWYAVVDGGRWIWIAEHQGRIAILGEVSAAQAPRILAPDAAEPGSRWFSGRGEWIVAERGIATVWAEEGELPWRGAPGVKRAYVDLSGAGGTFATIDFGVVGDDERPQGPRRFFVGHGVTVDELGLNVPQEVALPRVEGSRAVSCPRCAAPLTLKRPGETKTITCASCGSALSVDEKQDLGFLFAQILDEEPRIPLGTRAMWERPPHKGVTAPLPVEVVAFVVRSLVEDGETFRFREYLLATPKDGYFWLVETDDTWWLFRPVDVADVKDSGSHALYRGDRYSVAERFAPRVELVTGELYWRVQKGDRSNAADYLGSGGQKLSVERTNDEVNWTHGFRVPTHVVESVFSTSLPKRVSYDLSSGSPYGIESDGSQQLPPVVAWLIIALVLLILFAAMCGDCTGGGGTYHGGGGYSFGK